MIYFWFKLTRQRKKIIPYKVLVELTNKCNSKCVTCDIWKIPTQQLISLDIEKWEIFTSAMGKKLKWVAFSGGEVSLVSNFKTFVEVLKKNSKSLRIVTFTSNGLNPERIVQNALLLKNELKCDVFITLSLDGDAPLHDKIRGVEGNYEKVSRTFQLLKQNGIWCHFGVTVSKDNASFLIENSKAFFTNTRAVTIAHEGGLFLNENIVQKESDDLIIQALKQIDKNYKIKGLGEILIKLYIKLGVRFLESNRNKNIIPCDVGNSSVHLHADGALSPCMYLASFTKIDKEFSIKDYASPKAMELKESALKGNCPKCWMNCYAPHNMIQAPFSTLIKSVL